VTDAVAEQSRTPDDPEDLKLITLARAALGRTGAAQGAAVRDKHLNLSAVAVAVAMAVSSGAAGLEAVAVAGGPASDYDLDLLRDLPGAGVPVWSVDAKGQLLEASRL
jgi:hypothetical protein